MTIDLSRNNDLALLLLFAVISLIEAYLLFKNLYSAHDSASAHISFAHTTGEDVCHGNQVTHSSFHCTHSARLSVEAEMARGAACSQE